MSAKCHKQTLAAEKMISISPIAAVRGFPGLLAQDEWMQSPSHRETGEKDIGVILVGDDLSNERIPDVLIARDQPNCRGDGEVIENLNTAFVREFRSSCGQLCYIVFQVSAELVVVKAHAEAIVFPSVK